MTDPGAPVMEARVAMADPFRERPGAVRRAAAGAWHVLAGFWYLLRSPSLWPVASLPAILAVVCLMGGLMFGYLTIPALERALVPHAKVSEGVGFALVLVLAVGALGAGLVLGLAVALLLSAPLLELLSRKVDARVRGQAVDRSRGFRWEMAQSFRGTLYFLAAAPGVFLLTLIPIVGPPLAILWGSYALAFQQTDAALSRRGLDFAARREWHRYWKLESLGFGFAGLVCLIVPFANFLIAPALTVGGTLLVLELEDQLI
ncbi:MAG: EI24 domain-containing protein, partial [bacterium]